MKHLFFCIIFLFLSFSLSLSQELIEAVKSQNIEKVQQLLASGTDVDQEDSTGRTAIIWAARNGDSAMVNLLIEHKADINAYNDTTMTALMEAAKNGYFSIAQTLVNHKAKMNRVVTLRYDATLEKERNALFLAVENNHKDIVTLLLDNGADIDEQTTNYIELKSNKTPKDKPLRKFSSLGDTPLLIAVDKGNLDMAQYLIDRKADIEIQSEMLYIGRNIYLISDISYKSVEKNAYEDYINSISSNKPQKNDNALMMAVKNNDSAMTQLLMNAGADINVEGAMNATPLSLAVERGNKTIIKMLVEKGATVNHYSGRLDCPILSNGVMTNDTTLVTYLLDNKAKINEVTLRKNSALLIACDMGNPAMIRLLLSRKADKNLSNDADETPLMRASMGSCLECVQTLVMAGADLTLKNVRGKTALSYAKHGGNQEIIDFLIRVGAKESYETEE